MKELKASEFIHEQGYLFKNNTDFRNLIRCILEYDEISDLFDKFESEKDKMKEDRSYKMDQNFWNLIHGNISDDFIKKYIPKFIGRLNDKNGDYWMPKENDVLNVRVIEKKQQNWLVQLNDFEKEFYFRPRSYIENVRDGDIISICISKSWFYRRRLFVSGEIDRLLRNANFFKYKTGK